MNPIESKRQIIQAVMKECGGISWRDAEFAIQRINGASHLTKRETFAAQILSGLLASNEFWVENPDAENQISNLAVKYADALLLALAEEKKTATKEPPDAAV